MAELAARGLFGRIDLDVDAGECIAIMGGTGSGKSSLLLALAGERERSGGAISGPADGGVRLVLQRPESTLLEDKVLDEISLAGRMRGEPRAHAERRARDVALELGLPEDALDRDPLALSGGEQRRVAIAAVLASDPRILALDEPSAGLDATAGRELHHALLRLRAVGQTMLLVTHDPREAALLATRLIVLRDGVIVWDGAPGAVLGNARRAHELGLDVAPEIAVLHAVAERTGVVLEVGNGDPAAAVTALAQLVGAGTAMAATSPRETEAPTATQPATLILPPLVDARVRLLAAALAVVSAIAATSVVAAALVALVAALVVVRAPIVASRVRIAVRPLVGLGITLVALQLIVAGSGSVPLVMGRDIVLPAGPAIIRVLQASGIVLATLALSGATSTTDLAAGMRWWLAPLRLVRVPIETMSFVTAVGLGLVPVMADELERLRLAQRVRGIRPHRARLTERVRLDAQLLAPLFVGAFRRAGLLADALAVRGFDPAARTRSWRPRSVPPSDVVLLITGAALLVMGRFI